ncbi:transglycosylase domain-containing protein [bacterium]|nr:transglycosylase domain-containing protein [bacterium]
MAKKKSNSIKNGNKKNKNTSSKKKKLFLAFSKGLGIAFGFSFLFVIIIYLGFFGKIPTTIELSKIKHEVASEVYSADGKLMGKYYLKNRMSIENSAISKHVKNALIATEDQRFFEHGGLDFVSLGRVIVKTIILGNRNQGGGSTISQQLAKNLYPRKNYGFLTLPVNKISEMFVASRLEEIYSKEEILYLYLNTVQFGERVYGIEAAAQRFFSKRSAQLLPQEAAVLVGMLAANTGYSPRLNPKKSIARRNVVLKRMAEHGFLNNEQLVQYQDCKLEMKYKKIDSNTGIAPYFRDVILKEVRQILKEQFNDTINVLTDGLKIYTTIDSKLQSYADNAVQQHMKHLQNEFKHHWLNQDPWKEHPALYVNTLRRSKRYKELKSRNFSEEGVMNEMEKLHRMTIFAYPKEKSVNLSSVDSIKHYLKILHTGFLAVDPSKGNILAWVGGVNHEYFQYDHVNARRQVGSTFKPIVYAAALMDGKTPCDFISNEQRVYKDFNNWSPSNADGNHKGYYSLKGGLANSVNTISAELIKEVGVDRVIQLAKKMGIRTSLPKVPSLSLGVGEISLKEMITAYTTFANQGKSVTPVGLLRIEDANGNVLYDKEVKDEQERAMEEDMALLMTYLLKGVVERGSGNGLKTTFGLASEIAGKTGTTQNQADGWFIGYTSGLLAGTWVGAESPVVHFRSTTLGQGAHMALPIYARFMQQVERDPGYRYLCHTPFQPLNKKQLKMMDCVDYSLTDPDASFFNKLFKESEPDSLKIKEKEESRKKRLERRRNLLDKVKDLFN